MGLEGEQLGIVSIVDALAKAEAAEVDLVEIAPLAEPPVVRIMDYGKFKYRESKRAHEAKLKLKQIQVKEVKFRPGTDEGDYKIKLRNLTRFLAEGDKAKVTMRFRGREMAHQEFGRAAPAGTSPEQARGRSGATRHPSLPGREAGEHRRGQQIKGNGIMPKMKTKSGAKKRLRVRGSGSVKRGQAFKRHILTKKSTKSKRQLRGSAGIHATNMDSVKAMLPYA